MPLDPHCVNALFHSALDLSDPADRPAFREWAYARSWLTTALAARTDPDPGPGPIGDLKDIP